MKKGIVCIIAVALFTLTGTQAIAQENVIKINPFKAIIGGLGFQYERVLSDKTSAQVEFSFFKKTFGASVSIGSSSVGSETVYSGIGFGGEYRYYITNASRDVPSGAYVGPYISYDTFKQTVKNSVNAGGTGDDLDVETSIGSFGVGGQIGWQWLIGDVFAIDLNLGVGFRSVSDNSDDSDSDINFSLANNGIGLKSSFALGYAF